MSIKNPEQLAALYLRHYRQTGGSLPVFAGEPYQYGAGLGDVLRGALKSLLPIFTPIASRFITSTGESLCQGRSLKESEKHAIASTLT